MQFLCQLSVCIYYIFSKKTRLVDVFQINRKNLEKTMLSVYTNVASNIGRLNSIRAQAGQLRSMENLSSGQRINNSADDAVGLAVSNKILKTIKGLNASLKNISDGISLTQIAQNSASEISDMIIRIRELAIQNHNGTYSENDRLNSQHEVDALLKQIVP